MIFLEYYSVSSSKSLRFSFDPQRHLWVVFAMAPKAKTSMASGDSQGFTSWRSVFVAAAAPAVAVMYNFYAEAAAENEELRQKLAKVG